MNIKKKDLLEIRKYMVENGCYCDEEPTVQELESTICSLVAKLVKNPRKIISEGVFVVHLGPNNTVQVDADFNGGVTDKLFEELGVQL
jgi:hypothetical protein